MIQFPNEAYHTESLYMHYYIDHMQYICYYNDPE